MAHTTLPGVMIRGVQSCTPRRSFDNLTDTVGFTQEEVRKVTGMAGVARRRVAGDALCASDLCAAAADALLQSLGWDTGSVDGLIMITQTPDYFLPQTACVVHRRLGLSERCATLDVGLGCSGYPYGLWLASSMIRSGGLKRVLLLHGDTPSRYSHHSDRSVALLFGDAGSATALEAGDGAAETSWHFVLRTDSSGLEDMIIEGGGFRERFPETEAKHYVRMQGANVFNFTIKRVPALVSDALEYAGSDLASIDYFIFHQSNQFIMKHLGKKIGIPDEKAPIILKEFGNTGGSSIPLTLTRGGLSRPEQRALKLMLIGYGVGLSWAAAIIDLPPDAFLRHTDLTA